MLGTPNLNFRRATKLTHNCSDKYILNKTISGYDFGRNGAVCACLTWMRIFLNVNLSRNGNNLNGIMYMLLFPKYLLYEIFNLLRFEGNLACLIWFPYIDTHRFKLFSLMVVLRLLADCLAIHYIPLCS